VLDQQAYKGAEILISDANFGCGSSREHAPQAIQKFGLKAVIAESFAEIFHGNCTTLGIPCIVMQSEERQKLVSLVQTDHEAEIIIDIEALKVICANNVFNITMKESAREAFLSASYDPLDNLLAASDEIAATATKLGYA
jgi:3-isopropylmalate/(R)-2-methylmalate dehydratase small subunit